MIGELQKAIAAAVSFQPFSRVVSTDPTIPEVDAAPQESDEFDALLKQVLHLEDGNKVSEEELFAGIIQERIKALKGDEGLAKFQEYLGAEKAARTRPDGMIAVEDAARAALKSLVKDDTLTQAEGDKVHAEAFGAAQLDDNLQALFDGRGGPNDPTMAVAQLESALKTAKSRLNAYKTGTESAAEYLLSDEYDPYAGLSAEARSAMGRSAPTHSSTAYSGPSRPVDGANGFLFKPQSDSDGKLVILLPEFLTGDVSRVVLKNRRGKEIEQGAYRGIGNGDREHFRFRQRGDDYQKNMTVEVELKNGRTKTYKIQDPSQRYD